MDNNLDSPQAPASLKQLAQDHIDLLFAIMTLESGLEMDHGNLSKFLDGQAH